MSTDGRSPSQVLDLLAAQHEAVRVLLVEDDAGDARLVAGWSISSCWTSRCRTPTASTACGAWRAGAAMYAAKRAGRGRCAFAAE